MTSGGVDESPQSAEHQKDASPPKLNDSLGKAFTWVIAGVSAVGAISSLIAGLGKPGLYELVITLATSLTIALATAAIVLIYRNRKSLVPRRVPVAAIAGVLILAVGTGIGYVARGPGHSSTSVAGPGHSSPSVATACPTPQTRDDGALPSGWRIVGDVVVSAGTAGGFCITSPQIHWAGIFYPMTVCRYSVSLDGLITGKNAGYGLGVAITFNRAGEPVGNALQYEVHPRGSSENWGSGEHDVLYPQDEAWLHRAVTDNGWHHLTAIVGPGGYHFSVDGSIVAEGPQVNACGGVFLRVWDGAIASFRNIDIQPGG